LAAGTKAPSTCVCFETLQCPSIIFRTAKGILENFVAMVEEFGFVPNGGEPPIQRDTKGFGFQNECKNGEPGKDSFLIRGFI
jgi:hypothetical protein